MTSYIEKITEPVSQWYQGSGVHAFMSWWTAELKSMVPIKYQSALFPVSRSVYVTSVDAGDQAVEIWQQQEGTLKQLTFDDSVKGKEWWHKLNHYLGSTDVETEVTYLMDEDKVLTRNVAMPVAVYNDIDSVLSFELDKYIPFKADDVEFAYSKGEVVEGSEKFPVMLTTMKKQKLNELIDLFETRGVKLSSVDVNIGNQHSPQQLGVNLLPKGIRKKKDWTKIKWNAGLVVLTMLLMWFVMYSSLDNKELKIASLEEQVAELKKDARRAKLIETELNESIQAANFLGNLKSEIPSRILMFKELTTKVPMNTYLTRIMIDRERIEVVGESDNANALVPILNQSASWYEPRIIGNVTQNTRTNKEKFTIRSELKPATEEVADES